MVNQARDPTAALLAAALIIFMSFVDEIYCHQTIVLLMLNWFVQHDVFKDDNIDLIKDQMTKVCCISLYINEHIKSESN